MLLVVLGFFLKKRTTGRRAARCVRNTAKPVRMSVIKTPLTDLLGIEHPVMLAGMNAVAHADLVAAVSLSTCVYLSAYAVLTCACA